MIKEDFVQAVSSLLQSGAKQNKITLEKLARTFGITDRNLVKELTELAIVKEARKLAHQPGKTVAEKFSDIVALYKGQVNLSHRTSESVLLQQYSTPAPIGYLMGVYCGIDVSNEYLFEPSAGNGLLTIAGSPEFTFVNEIDTVRNNNLKTQGFSVVTKLDASKQFPYEYHKNYKFVITNPPFGRLPNGVEVEGYTIKDLDHIMAIHALDCMEDHGRAAIIIGGHTTWDEHGRVTQGKNRIFFNYLHKHYHVLDTILIDGHELYSRQGTSFNTRLILIDGRKEIEKGVAPLKSSSDLVVTTFYELFNRVMRFVEPVNQTQSSPMKLRLKLKAKALKEKLKLSESALDGFDGLDMPYVPASQICNSLDVDTPDSMGYEIHLALKKLKLIVGNVEEYVQKKLGYATHEELCKAISAEQSDAVALAIYNIEERGQALIVGDQTGIGKGRIAAAMVRYGRVQGMHPIFITEKPNLFSDLYRDLKAIGSETLKPYIVNSRDNKTHVKDEDGNVIFEALDATAQKKIIESGNLPNEFDYVMLTYSQISGGEISKTGMLIGKSPKGSWVERIAKGNVIIMDESHNASGDSNTGKILQDIISATKGVTFLSATFAKRPDNMPIYAMKTAMSEANMSKTDLVVGIEKGGVALQEVLSAQLVQHGQMIRRERSFEGIEVNYITLDDKAAEHRAISDNITQIVRNVIAFQKDYVDGEVESLDRIAAKTNTGSNVEKRAGTKGA
nr:strawberry notch family protein [Chryseolinea sp.]